MKDTRFGRKGLLEKEIQSSICDYLDLRKHFWWRNNSGAYKAEHGAFIRFGTPSSPDIILVRDGRSYFLEVKQPGSYQSAEQKQFQERAEVAGALYAVFRSIEDVQQLGL